MRHLSSGHHISMTVAQNPVRPGPLETRHRNISRHIKFEENRVQKGPQTVTQSCLRMVLNFIMQVF